MLLRCSVQFLASRLMIHWPRIANKLNRVWKEGLDRAFPLPFHDNPESRIFATSILNTVLFPNNASKSRFWRIPLPERRTNPYPVKKF